MKDFYAKLENWDSFIIKYTKKGVVPFSRFAIFVVYFWFGALKVFSLNGAANPLVIALLSQTLPGVDPAMFLIVLGVLEMLIGLIFIIPHLERLGLFIITIHLFATILPIFILPDFTWQSFMVPTLEGQYIIKNILIIALAIGILSHLRLLKNK